MIVRFFVTSNLFKGDGNIFWGQHFYSNLIKKNNEIDDKFY